MYLIWTNVMHNRYRDWMRKVRDWVAEQALAIHGIAWDKEDMFVIRGHHPIWILEPFWHQIIDQVFIYILCGLCILFVL